MLTDVILVGIVEGVDDCWFCGPFVLVDRQPQFQQVVVSVVAKHVHDVQQELVFRHIQLLTNTVKLARSAQY